MGRIFGTDGARGVANTELTCELAFRLGQAFVRYAGNDLVLGRDTRRSGLMLEDSLVAGIMSSGGTAHLCGIIPTPAVALLTRELGLSGGVVISASHNPPEFNGIKLFSGDGKKLSDAVEDEIEEYLVNGVSRPEDRPIGDGVGKPVKVEHARQRYVAHAIDTIEGDLEGLTIAVDCAHGAACKTTPAALRDLGAEVFATNTRYTGVDINVNCGSTHLGPIRELVAQTGACCGFAHDGDADRVLFVDENGDEVDGDAMLAICAVHLKEQGLLPGNEVVSTVMANLGFVRAMERRGIKVVQTQVGDRYVLERMVEDGVVLGGEQSGHIIFLDHNSTGDGLITALQVLAIMKKTDLPLSRLAKIVQRYPQRLINVSGVRKDDLDTCEAVWAAVRKAEAKLGDRGRVLVRASGTEPLVRVMVEAASAEDCDGCAEAIAAVVEEELS